MDAPTPLTIAANGLRHRVWRWEPIGAPAGDLVIVHGITNSGRGWDFVARELRDLRRVYAVDLRGHGESDKPETGYSASDMAGDLAGVIAGLGLARPDVLGHSLGGRAAARLAADVPDRVGRLILVDPPVARRYPAEVESVMRGFVATIEATRQGGTSGVRTRYPHWTDEQVAARVEAHHQVSDRVMLDQIDHYDPGTTLDDLPRIATPILFVYADASVRGPAMTPGLVPAELVATIGAAMRDGRMVRIERAGHMIPWDNRAEFIAAVRGFLAND